MNRWEALTTVCAHLRAGLLGGAPPSIRGTSWERVVEASSQHNVTPVLAWCLRNRTDVPADARDYFATILSLNAERNEVLYRSLIRVVAACNSIGIEPVPMKGAARLVEGTYPSRSLRFLGDLDILIPAERSADAAAALRAIGFCERADDEPCPPDHHHLPMLYDAKGGGGVELHTKLIGPDSLPVAPTAWFQQGTRPCAFEGLRIRLPDATRSIAHIVLHDQIHHTNFRFRRIQLRAALDVAMIRAQHEDAIDWAMLDERFCRARFGEVLPTFLAFNELLFGQPAPRLQRAPRLDSIAYWRRRVGAPRLQRLSTIWEAYVERHRRHPIDLLGVFSLRRWPGRIRQIRAALAQKPWIAEP